MALADGRTADGLAAALALFASETTPLPPIAMHVASIGGFLAIVPREPSARLRRLADLAVERFDRFRASPSTADLARRRHMTLSPRQEEYLARWGYPYVFDEFRFHMTLTGRLPEADRARIGAHLTELLAPALAVPVALGLSLFEQPTRDVPFRLARRFPHGALV
jgi:hypothetical protein